MPANWRGPLNVRRNPNPRATTFISPNELLLVPIQRPRPLTVEKTSKCCYEDGLLSANILVKGPPPKSLSPYFPYKGQIDINEKYSVAVCLYPNGFSPVLEYSDCISLLLGVYSGDAESLFAKFQTSILASDGSRSFRKISKDFLLFPCDLFLKIRNVGSTSEVMEASGRYIQNSMVHFEVSITIDTRRKPPLNIIEYEPENVLERIRGRIHDSEFGNIAFTVSGVKMFAHREILMRNSRIFRELFRTAVLKCGIYNLPDTYPQALEKRIMSCYLQERIICRKCFLHPEKCTCHERVTFCRKAK